MNLGMTKQILECLKVLNRRKGEFENDLENPKLRERNLIVQVTTGQRKAEGLWKSNDRIRRLGRKTCALVRGK